jgi:hypothetical protein
MEQDFPENEQAKRLLSGESCWNCQYSVKGSFDPKDWMCRNHLRSDILGEERDLQVPKELICDFYLRLGATPESVVDHLHKMAKKYAERQAGKTTS